MLSFNTTDDSLLIRGKTFYVKETIKNLGGQWNKASSCWTLPVFLDSDQLRYAMQKDAEAACKAERKKRRDELKAARDYWASPEGQAQAAEEQRQRVKRALQEKAKTGAYWWICCEECRVIDWHKKHTSCSKCAEWDGYCWNSFRVNGSIFTGD
jgi:hypothetical protein